jgi:hypothetical protein
MNCNRGSGSLSEVFFLMKAFEEVSCRGVYEKHQRNFFVMGFYKALCRNFEMM